MSLPARGGEALIVEAVRTPVGRGHPEKGAFRELHPAQLLGPVYAEVLRRAGLDSEHVDNAIAGCVYQIAEQSSGIARLAWLQEGLAEATGASTVDVRCGSGQQAVNLAATRIAAGVDEVVVAAGVEHMGRIGFPVQLKAQELWGQAFTPKLLDRFDLVPQGESAELIADRWQIERDEMDALALRSHRRAEAARSSGAFAREIVAIETPDGEVSEDQGIRPETSLAALGSLVPAFRADGRVTAGNSSQISDGAAALLLCSPAAAERYGLRPRARVVDQVLLGVDPVLMLTGPIPATVKILARNGLAIGDLDAIEVNEAFASVVLAWQRELDPDIERVNPRGGAIALGHPLGATGARLITSLLHELEDLGGELGLVTMCCAGGLGIATLIERV